MARWLFIIAALVVAAEVSGVAAFVAEPRCDDACAACTGCSDGPETCAPSCVCAACSAHPRPVLQPVRLSLALEPCGLVAWPSLRAPVTSPVLRRLLDVPKAAASA